MKILGKCLIMAILPAFRRLLLVRGVDDHVITDLNLTDVSGRTKLVHDSRHLET